MELETIKNLVKKYSQFINFPIFVWASKVNIYGVICVENNIYVKLRHNLPPVKNV